MTSSGLTLSPGSWYGWQMLPGYAGQRMAPYFSPIQIMSVTPKKTGKSILNVAFWNVLYAEGVQDFALDLRIRKHEANYLIADVLYAPDQPQDRSCVISHIEFEWIRRLCPDLWAQYPPERMSAAAQTSVSVYLNEVFGGQ